MLHSPCFSSSGRFLYRSRPYFWFFFLFFRNISKSFTTHPANIGPQDVPWVSPSNVPRTSPKDHIWPSWGRLGLTFWRHPEMTSRGRPNLTFKGRPWEVDSGRPLEDLQSTQTWMSKIFFNFSFRTYSIDQI